MKKVVLATALLLGSASAFAVTAQSGIYVGALGGYSFADSFSNSSMNNYTGLSNTTSKDRNFTYGANLGYNYAINQNYMVGLELGYVNFGATDYNFSNGQSTDYKNYGINALVTGTYLMNNGFNAFAKAGVIRQTESNTSTTQFPTTGQFLGGSTSEVLPTVAVGVGYMPIQNVNVALQYQRTFGDTNTDVTTDNGSEPQAQNAVTLGVTYLFAM